MALESLKSGSETHDDSMEPERGSGEMQETAGSPETVLGVNIGPQGISIIREPATGVPIEMRNQEFHDRLTNAVVNETVAETVDLAIPQTPSDDAQVEAAVRLKQEVQRRDAMKRLGAEIALFCESVRTLMLPSQR